MKPTGSCGDSTIQTNPSTSSGFSRSAMKSISASVMGTNPQFASQAEL